MTNTSSKNALSFLQTGNQDLHALLAKVKRLNELNTALTPYLDRNIRDYCQVANIVGQQLILIAANGSIATQVRFQSADLLQKFKQDPILNTIQSIHCKVRPSTTQPTASTSSQSKKLPPLSLDTANLIQDIAQSIEDPAVRAALEKIAKNTEKKGA